MAIGSLRSEGNTLRICLGNALINYAVLFYTLPYDT
jgi:hypothetical protein